MSAKSTTNKSKSRLEFRVLGPVVKPQRACDGCTVCCTLPDIPEVDSPPYVPCRHQGECGCGIYAERPQVCRDFSCEWLRGNAPEWMKPDVCGVMPGHTADHGAMQLWEVWPDSAQSPRVLKFIQESNRRGIHVVVRPHPSADSPTPRNRVHLATGEVREFEGLEFNGTVIRLR